MTSRTWTGHYLDGKTSERLQVTVHPSGHALLIMCEDGHTMTWPYGEVRQTQGAYKGEPVRLEYGLEPAQILVIADPDFLTALHRTASAHTAHLHNPLHRGRRKYVTYVVAVTLLVIGGTLGLWGIPRLASVVTPWVLIVRSSQLYEEGQYAEAIPLLQQALAIREKALGPEHPDTAQLLNNLGAMYSSMGAYSEAEPLYKRALAIAEQALGPDDPHTATALSNLAGLYHDAGANSKAEPLIQRALAITEKALGPEHPDTATTLNNLGELYRTTGAYAQAELHYQRALAIWEKALGPNHQRTSTALNNLGELYREMGAYQKAEALHQRALAIREKVLGPDHPDTANSLSNLALLYLSSGTYEKAEPLYQRALAIWEKALGPDHPNTANSLKGLAGLYRDTGAYEKAEPRYQRALAIQEKVLGPDHPDTAVTINNLAELYRKTGAYIQAEPGYLRALAIWQKVFGLEHTNTAMALNNLAALYDDMGDYEKAELHYQRALAIQQKALGPEHPDIATALNNLAGLYRNLGAYPQAEPLLKRALAIREKVLGREHPDTAMALNNLAELYHDLGVSTQVEPLLQQAQAIQEKVLGPEHPGRAVVLNNLGTLYLAQGAFAQAEPLLKRALAIRENAFGPKHSATATALNNLAELYQAQGAYDKAEPLFQQALAIQEKVLGLEHPDTARSLNNLAVLNLKQGVYIQAEPLLKRALAIKEKVWGPEHPDTALILRNLGVLRMRIQPDAQAADWLYRSAQSRWRYMTENFPFLTSRQQQQFLTRHVLDEDGSLWHLFPTLDRAVGYQITLWNKQLLTEVTRQESSAVQRILAKAPAEWQALWRDRQSLRQIYANLAFHELRPKTAPSAGEITTRLEELEQRLRRENPAYAEAATLQDITVTQVQQALQPDQALLEYLQFHPYDDSAKQLAKALHYGVYVVRGGQTKVGAVDLGDAAPIDAAIREFRMVMLKQEQRSKERITPSSKQLLEEETQLAKASATLRQLVWQPVETALTNVTRVYVAPDGQLSVFPFEALARKTKRGTWQYLVEEQRDLVHLNTGRDLARLALTAESTSASNMSPRTAVLIGNPKFDAQPKEVAQVVAGLPTATPRRMASNAAGAGGTLGASASQDEFRVPRNWDPIPELSTLLMQADQQLRRTGWTVTSWRDQQAVEPAVLQLQAPRILQFATHGYLLERANPEQTGNWDNPLLRSMLMMAGVNHATPEQAVFYRVGKDLLTEAEAQQRQLSSEARQQARIDIGDGILTAYEVSGMNLQGTELVNLTACQTGLGEVMSQGVAGLRQAFFFAGARALTTSLWEVPVSETTEQMSAFYERWLGTGTPSARTRYAAFRQTQLTALAQARKTYGAGHPFFWAGFIYLGDPGDLPRENSGMRKTAAKG